jgi:hypothetical protein
MKTIARTGLLGILLAGCASGAGDDGAPSAFAPTAASLVAAPNPQHAKLATRALSQVRSLVTKQGGPRLGFRSPAELDAATLGAAVPVYFTTGERILARTLGADPLTLLGTPDQMLFPIVVDGTARAAVVMSRNATGEWEVTSVGRSDLVRRIELAGRAHATAGVAVVVMHDLGVNLLAYTDGSEVRLRALDEQRSAGVPAGEGVPAETAFAQLADVARLRTSSFTR